MERKSWQIRPHLRTVLFVQTLSACLVARSSLDPPSSACDPDAACDAVPDCTGGVCLSGLGAPCSTPSQCASGFCADAVCCDSACDGLCMACDAAGECNELPADDAACGSIDCDGLDTVCRDFVDLTASRCKSLGICKQANSADCALFVDSPSSTVCRVAADTCDVEDRCDGSGGCAPDAKRTPGTECRPGAGTCDPAETCDGVNNACPSDLVAANGDPCEDGDSCTAPDTCQAGLCQPGPDTCPPPCSSIGFDASSTTWGSATNRLVWSHTTAGTERLLVVGVSLRPGIANVQVRDVTYGTTGLVFVGADNYVATIRVELWQLVAPATGTDDITVNLTGAGEDVVGGAITLTGCSQTSPIEASGFLAGSGTAASATVTTSTLGAWVLDTVAFRSDGGPDATPQAGQIRRWIAEQGSAVQGCGSTAGPQDPPGSVTMTWTLPASVGWAVGAVSVAPSCP